MIKAKHFFLLTCLMGIAGCGAHVLQKDVPGVYILRESGGIEVLFLNPDNSYRQVVVGSPTSAVMEHVGKWSFHKQLPSEYVALDEALVFDPPGFSTPMPTPIGLGCPVGYVGGTLTLYLDESGERGFKRIGDLGNKGKGIGTMGDSHIFLG